MELGGLVAAFSVCCCYKRLCEQLLFSQRQLFADVCFFPHNQCDLTTAPTEQFDLFLVKALNDPL